MQRVEEVNRQEGMTPEEIEREKEERARTQGRRGESSNAGQSSMYAKGSDSSKVRMKVGSFEDLPGQLQGFEDKSNAAAARERDISAMGAGRQEQVRQDQLALNSALQARMAGKTPSVAEMQMKQGQDAALNQALAMKASARGVNAAVANMQASDQMAAMSQQAVSQSAQMRAQEQMSAEQALGANLSGMRGQDLGQEQLSLQTQLQQQQMNDQMVQSYLQAGLTMQEAQLRAQVDLEKARVEQKSQKRAQNMGLLGSGAAAGGQALAAGITSDQRAKQEISTSPKGVREFMDAIAAREWNYKDQKHGKGRYAGIMAQDAEKSRLGKEMVQEVDGVKTLDMRKGFSLALAGVADLNARIKRLEKKRG